MNYNNRVFRPVSSTENGEVSGEVKFHYKQIGEVVFCNYSGEKIIQGQLIGLVAENGCITMNYHQVNVEGQLKTGKCYSRPEILPNGKIRLYEFWEWTSGDFSKGESILEEV